MRSVRSQVVAGAGLVLDGDGLRGLRAVVMRLRDGMRLVGR